MAVAVAVMVRRCGGKVWLKAAKQRHGILYCLPTDAIIASVDATQKTEQLIFFIIIISIIIILNFKNVGRS